MKFNLIALSTLLALAAAADSTTSTAAPATTLSAEAQCAQKCNSLLKRVQSQFHDQSQYLTRLDIQATPTTSAALLNATTSPAPATARPTTPTAVSLLAPRALARPPTPRSTPTVSRNATARTSSLLPVLLPRPPTLPRLALLPLVARLPRLARPALTVRTPNIHGLRTFH